MKRLTPILLFFALLLFACSIPSTSTPTEPPQVTEPPVVPNVTCNELSLYLDPALGSGYDCETVPASTVDMMEMYPEHTRITLQGYPLSGKFFEPMLRVYSVAAYAALRPELVPAFIPDLQARIAGSPAPVFNGSFDNPHLPFLPIFPAAQVFFANYQVVPFTNGGGIRFMTEYGQYLAPANNTDLFYTYQGLTSDGLYWVSAILPINHPILPADAQAAIGSASWEDFTNNFQPYITDMVNQLNAQPGDSYLPTLGALDALVTSIAILP